MLISRSGCLSESARYLTSVSVNGVPDPLGKYVISALVASVSIKDTLAPLGNYLGSALPELVYESLGRSNVRAARGAEHDCFNVWLSTHPRYCFTWRDSS